MEGEPPDPDCCERLGGDAPTDRDSDGPELLLADFGAETAGGVARCIAGVANEKRSKRSLKLAGPEN